jgi:hypothetical protein
MLKGNFDLHHHTIQDRSPPQSIYKEKMRYKGPVSKEIINIKAITCSSVEFGKDNSKFITENQESFIKPQNTHTVIITGNQNSNFKMGNLKTQRTDFNTVNKLGFTLNNIIPSKFEISNTKNDHASHHFKMGHHSNYDTQKHIKSGRL